MLSLSLNEEWRGEEDWGREGAGRRGGEGPEVGWGGVARQVGRGPAEVRTRQRMHSRRSLAIRSN